MLTPQGFTETAPNTATPPEFQLVPHSLDAEAALLGGLILDPSQMREVDYLDKSDFYLVNNGFLYEAMKSLFTNHGGYDWLTVTEHLKRKGRLDDIGGEAAITDLINMTPTSYGVPEYAAIIYRHSISRQVLIKAQSIFQSAHKDVAGRPPNMLVSESIQALAEIDATKNLSDGPKSVSDGVSALLDHMEQIERSGQVVGLKSGIQTLDYYLCGFQKQNFYLLAGRPGMGKSGLALQIAYNVSKSGASVLYFSLEMSKKSLAGRLVSSVCGVPYDNFNRPGINPQQCLDITMAAGEIAGLPILIDDTPALTVSAMRSLSQKLMVTEPIGLLIVDHLGLIKPERNMRDSYHEISQISHSLMALSKQLDIPVLALCQLSRAPEKRTDKRPMAADLRDTGKLEEDADGILFLYRDEVYNPDTEFPHLAEIIIAKNRGGKLGTATIYADMPTNRFIDLETRREAL